MTNEQKKQILLDLIKIEEDGEIFNFTRAERAEFQMWVNGLLEQEPCDDCVSRKAALEKAKSYNTDGWDMYTPLVVDVEDIEELPPVTPIRPKGYWREVDTNMYACSKCSHVLTIDPLDNSILEMNTCPFCSAKMEGVVEE